MYNEIKVSLTIVLKGSTIVSKEECLKTIQKTTTKKTKDGKIYKRTVSTIVEDWDKMNKHLVRIKNDEGKLEYITFHTRKTKPAIQQINIFKESYEYMISRYNPYWCGAKKWNSMNAIQRLEAHLQNITESLNGVFYTYQIFED